MEVTRNLESTPRSFDTLRKIDQLLKKIEIVQAICATQRNDLHRVIPTLKELSIKSCRSPNRFSLPEEGKRNTGDILAAQGRFLKDAAFRP